MTELQWLEKQLEEARAEKKKAQIRMSVADRFSARRAVSRGFAYACHMVVIELEQRIKEIKGN